MHKIACVIYLPFHKKEKIYIVMIFHFLTRHGLLKTGKYIESENIDIHLYINYEKNKKD